MLTVGSVGLHYRSLYRLTLGRCVNRVLTATRLKYRPKLDWVLVEYRLSIGRLSVNISTNVCVDRYGF